MQTKTYFANNVPAAIDVARRELGADALLVYSRPAPAHVRQFGRVEVTFACDPPEPGKPVSPASPDPKAITVKDHRVFERLCEAGMGAGTARETAREIPDTTLDPQSAVIQALAARIPVAPFGEVKPGQIRTLAFIGPPGRGKTTSLVKIAVAEGLARRIPVRIYSAGAHGIGGKEQIARYAAILGVPHQSCESTESLALALKGENWKGLALIDTPGISVSDRDQMRDLARFFAGQPEIEKHLVLRADARSADMLHVIARFAGLQPSRLLFTGTDDALSAGAMAETLIRAGIPATFAGTGQRIPEDLEQVDASNLARDVWAGSWVETRVRSRAAAA